MKTYAGYEDCDHCGAINVDDLMAERDALADALDAATTPPEATSAHESAPQPSEAPEGAEGAERPTAANLGRIGWLSLPEWGRSFLVREFEEGWTSASDDAPNEWFARENVPDAIFTPLTPADFGWTVLSEGQVAVKREDVEFALHAMRAARHETESPATEARLRAALDGSES